MRGMRMYIRVDRLLLRSLPTKTCIRVRVRRDFCPRKNHVLVAFHKLVESLKPSTTKTNRADLVSLDFGNRVDRNEKQPFCVCPTAPPGIQRVAAHSDPAAVGHSTNQAARETRQTR